jgi:hypothetical protein
MAGGRAAFTLALVATACIIPDRDISFEADEANPGAVRIVQPTPLAPDMIAECTDEDADMRDLDQCPQVPTVGARHSGLIRRPADAPFCVCPGGHDARTLDEFFIYAEDPDRSQERPVDALLAVALLDFDPFAQVPPFSAVAYRQQLPEGGKGELLLRRNEPPSPGLNIVPSSGREDNFLWRFRFGKSGGRGTDLCNDNDGKTVAVGLHTLSVMVTDRPFFRPPQLDADGEPVLGQDGEPLYEAVQTVMPDLAVGATYSIASWVFECHSPEVNSECACAEGPPP